MHLPSLKTTVVTLGWSAGVLGQAVAPVVTYLNPTLVQPTRIATFQPEPTLIQPSRVPITYVTLQPATSARPSSTSSSRPVVTIINPYTSSSPQRTTSTTSSRPVIIYSTSTPRTTTSSSRPVGYTSSTPRPTSRTTIIQNPTVILDRPRETNVLATIRGQYNLPGPNDVIRDGSLNTTDIQGDILVGMKKKIELFYFFSINDVPSWKKKFRAFVVPRITSTLQLLSTSTQPQTCLNVAYSFTGLSVLGFPTHLNDPSFGNGQFANAQFLGDTRSNWIPEFTTRKIHGVFLIASDDMLLIQAMVQFLENLFLTDWTKQYELLGNIRPPPFEGHEMFGYLDGVGQPAVQGFNINPVPGQEVIPPGVILVNEPGDQLLGSRPAWAKDGSFLVFRQLKQLVPEFDKYLAGLAPTLGMTKDLLGARMVGRWKSGAPIDLRPVADDPALGADPNQNNLFDYSHPGFNLATDQSHCPFSAHTRKTRPRADQPAPFNAIMRAGIPYGPELTATEEGQATSSTAPDMERGLAFVSYQSILRNGFEFMQTAWVNDVNFPTGKNVQPGFDPIVGQINGGPRMVNGLRPGAPNQQIQMLREFVISRGGEYFFAPSINTLANVLHN